MDKQTVFVKTDRGRDALVSRPAGLGPRLRSLLIMVDGRRSVGELGKMLGSEEAAQDLLEQLRTQGWVDAEEVAQVASAMAQAASAPASSGAPSAGALPFAEARRLVVRFVNDQLGPMGEPLAMRVESCKNAGELAALLPRLRDGLLNFKNAATVSQFDQEVVPRLPAA